jgi:hypothetical protein
MSMHRVIYLTGVIAIVIGLYLFRLWQPELQVRKHSAHLTEAIANKDWTRFASFIADDYHDQWGNDRATVLQATHEIFRPLREVRISAIGPNIRFENGVGYWRALILVDGVEDNEVMRILKARVNTLQTPFELEWHHMSGKPWDWKLGAVRNSELKVSSAY